jgi:hypothetical protein
MPFVAPKRPPPPRKLVACLGPSVGRADDFWALGYCPELDELELATHPNHTAFTHVFRYQSQQRTFVTRFPRRLDGLWQQSNGTLLAVGNTEGYVEINASGMSEVALPGVPGIFSSIWGLNDDHVFATGVVVPFVYYRRRGQWLALPLPDGTEDIRAVRAFAEDDVYFVGPKGQVLHFDGLNVVRLRAPVRRWLTGIERLDKDRMCICGYQGTFMVGNKTSWRHLVTNTTDTLLAVGTLGGKAYYGADGKVYETDGATPPAPVIDFDATWVSSLADGLVLSSYTEAKVQVAGALVDLDVTL